MIREYDTHLKPFPYSGKTVDFYVEHGMKAYTKKIPFLFELPMELSIHGKEAAMVILQRRLTNRINCYNDENNTTELSKTKVVDGVNPIFILGYEYMELLSHGEFMSEGLFNQRFNQLLER